MTRERIPSLAPDEWLTRAVEFNVPELTPTLALPALITELAAEKQVSAPAAAIAWPLGQWLRAALSRPAV